MWESRLTLKAGSRFTLLDMRISELAEQAGIAPSTLRYYERIGLMPTPARTPSGYRTYDDAAAARLLFVTRAKRLGLGLEQIGELLDAWTSMNCSATHRQVSELVELKRAELRERIDELQHFADRLDEVGALLRESPPPLACLPDLSCCVPATDGDPVRVHLTRPT
jgi:DNA-binding transcriptional MerR regulator